MKATFLSICVGLLLVHLVVLALIVWDCGGLDKVARDHKYKSGTGWCFWRWTDVDSEYILRLHVVKTPWGAVCLHWIRKPDAEPWLHDHPVSFLSLILRGGYVEKRWSLRRGEYLKLNSWFNIIRATDGDRHRIILAKPNTLTLCFMGPKTREWGFHMPDGWIMWKDYYAKLRAGFNMRQEPIIAALEREMTEHYTAARINALAGAPDGTLVDKTGRIIDPAPAEDFDAEEVTEEIVQDDKPECDFVVSREDFYRKGRF